MVATLPENFQFSKIRTECKQCCFASWDKTTQVGCEMDVLDKIPTENIIPVYDEENVNFFVLNDKHCPFCRNKEWAEKVGGESPKDAVLAETQLRMSYLIWYDDTSNFSALNSTLNSADSQYLRPTKITIINRSNTPIKANVQSLNLKTRWAIENIMDLDRSKDELIHFCVVKSSKKEGWFGIFHSGCYIPPYFNLNLNRALVDDLKTIAVVMPNSLNDGGCFNKFVFNGALGNREMNFFDKMKEIYNPEVMPYSYELCPHFQK